VKQDIFISAIYSSQNLETAISRSSVDNLLLVCDKEGASEKVDRSIREIEQKFHSIHVDKLRSSPYDMKYIASGVAEYIRENPDANISINLTPGRKTQSFAQMFAAYANPSLVDDLFYYREEGGRIRVPIHSIEINENALEALREVISGAETVQKVNSRLGVSTPMVYSYIEDLRESGYVHGDTKNLKATQAGELVSALM
jgi:CRISPR locus-related DNA-binding protein